MEPGNLLKLYGGLYGDDGDFVCFADGLAMVIEHYHGEVTSCSAGVMEHLKVYYDGSIAFCLSESVIEIFSNENR